MKDVVHAGMLTICLLVLHMLPVLEYRLALGATVLVGSCNLIPLRGINRMVV